MRGTDLKNVIYKDSLPVAVTSLLIALGIFIGVILLVTQRNTRQQTLLDNTPASYVETIQPIQKGTNATVIKDASNANQFFMSGYRFDLGNDWQHIKNITGIKDTNFISNFIQVDKTTTTNGDATQVFYIKKGDFTFYVSNQFITENNLFDQDGVVYTELITPTFSPDGVYLAYSTVTIDGNDIAEVQLRKQMSVCPYNFNNLCFASGVLPLTVEDNKLAVDAFKEFLNSISIYVQN